MEHVRMKKDYYVILTGSKNNAGDYLIKYRAKQLFASIRPDRDIIDLNGWELLDKQKLEVVNNSKALILMGGPALQKNMSPDVYRLTDNLEDITCPIVSMGIGWYDKRGNWEDTYHYPVSESSKKLLEKVARSGLISSVRDYHTLNALNSMGYNNYLMTGCPAYYDLSMNGTDRKINFTAPHKVAFSLGVSFVDSPKMDALMKENILAVRDQFPNSQFEVALHHSLDKEKYLSSHGASALRAKQHISFAEWLKAHNIHYVDISGSAENLVNYYRQVDIHVGYRVHAHIFMNSIAKLSFLLAEDGRAKGVRRAIGGLVFDGYINAKKGFVNKVLNKLFAFYSLYQPNNSVTAELVSALDYEQKFDFPRAAGSQRMIENNYHQMKIFLEQLP